jgi:hypothetical protein
MPGPRYAELTATAGRYKDLAAENYGRIRELAETLRTEFCAYLGSDTPPCVRLVPPGGPFEPKDYGDGAFSIPAKGFQPLGPISFGLAVRVTDSGDWLRAVLTCRKEGDTFIVRVEGGPRHEFDLPLADQEPAAFLDMLYEHLLNWFKLSIDDYEHGQYGQREIGFDFFRAA